MGSATELAPSDFVSQNYETLVALMQEETKKRSSQSLQARLNFGPEDEVSPPRHQKERRGKDNRRPPVFRKGHWKSKNKYREDEDEDMSLPWRRQKVDAFTRRISDFSEDKRRRMPANVKNYDGTGDPDDHLKIFESAATIENWPQPVWCHMFNSMLVGNARNWFSKLPRRSIDGFEELRRAFSRLNFTQRKRGVPRTPVELSHGTYQKANDRIQTFDELMKRTRSFIQGEAAAADSRKGYSNNRSQEQSRRQSNDQSSSRNNSYRGQRGGRGNDKYTPLTMTPKEILATEGSNFPKPPPMRTPEEQRVGNGYCEYHRQKGHTTNKCVQLRQLIDKLVKEGRLDHLVKNIKEGKDKQRGGGKKDAPRDKADTIYMVQSWQRKTKQKVSQKFSQGSTISFPTLTTDNVVVEPLTIEINAAGHDIHRMYIDGGASADILYEHCFQRLRPEVKSQLNPATTSLTGFTGEKIWPMGQLRLPVIVGNKEHSTTAWMNFMVIRSPSPYNGIIGRPGISAIRAVPSTAHGMLKFPVDGGIVTIYNTAAPPKECNTILSKSATSHVALSSKHSRSVRKKGDFRWTIWKQRSFTQLKQHIAALPTLVAPRPGEELIMYLSATHGAISAVLLTDRGSVQTETGILRKNKSSRSGDIFRARRTGSTSMTPIVLNSITLGTAPHEQKDARRIRRTAQRFELREGVLYRRSFLQPWLRCVGPIQADYVLREIHAGSCSNALTMHSGHDLCGKEPYGLVLQAPIAP
ncbi:reverse transcriptase domain-containing protein [Tanacetum coccineum]